MRRLGFRKDGDASRRDPEVAADAGDGLVDRALFGIGRVAFEPFLEVAQQAFDVVAAAGGGDGGQDNAAGR
ncbi:MAG TPA: hypothetical protein VHY76_14145 [Acetobacteraceae bacterium]|nr:hypothetical protein [Acetobacteraceae bacterium]